MTRYADLKRSLAEIVNVRTVRKTKTAKAHAAIRDIIVENPSTSYQQIADWLGCSRWLVYTVATEFNVRRPRRRRQPGKTQQVR